MAEVDKRLLDSRSQAEIDENFKRILSLIDALTEKPGTPGPKGDPGPQGDPGVGVKTITGSIDGSNKLTLTFTLTDGNTQTVEGAITPPAAG